MLEYDDTRPGLDPADQAEVARIVNIIINSNTRFLRTKRVSDKSMWILKVRDRIQKLQKWHQRVEGNHLNNSRVVELLFMIKRLRTAHQQKADERDAYVFDHLNGIFTTFSHFAFRRQAFAKLAPKILVVDEAAYKSARWMPLLYLSSVECIVLVGDHLQLGERIDEDWLSREESSTYTVDISLLDQIHETQCLPTVTLECQYRMQTELAEVFRQLDHYETLYDHSTTTAFPVAESFRYRTWWMTHNWRERVSGSTHLSENLPDVVPHVRDTQKAIESLEEVRMAVAIAGHAIRVGGVSSCNFTILTLYRANSALIREIANEEADLMVRDIDANRQYDMKFTGVEAANFLTGVWSLHEMMPISTYDAFQGKKNDIVIL